MSLVQVITLLMPTFRRLAILPVAILLRPRAITTTATTGVRLRLLIAMPLILRPLLRDLELRLVDLRLVLVMITNGLLGMLFAQPIECPFTKPVQRLRCSRCRCARPTGITSPSYLFALCRVPCQGGQL